MSPPTEFPSGDGVKSGSSVMTSAMLGISVVVLTAAVCSTGLSVDDPAVAFGFPWQAELTSKVANTNPINPFFHLGCNETIVRLYTGCTGA